MKDEQSTGSTPAKVGAGVYEALEEDAEVFVVVSLLERASTPPATELPNRRRAIARLQDAVLARLPPSDFRLASRFEAVPAFTGWTTKEGLSALEKDPDVRRIDLDSAGCGTGTGMEKRKDGPT